MLDFDAKGYADAELRTVAEKSQHCRLQAIGQILSLIISVVLIGLTILTLNYVVQFAIVTLLVVLIASLGFSVFLIYWGFTSARLLRDSTDLYQGAVRPGSTLVALIGSILFAGIAEVYIFIGWFFQQWYTDYQIAQASQSSSASVSSLTNIFIWFLILSVVQFLLFLYSAFAAYITIPGESTLRRVFAVSNLFTCALAGLVLYFCYVANDYISLGNLVSLPSQTIVNILWWVALIVIVASIIGILINLRRSKVLYFILGGALLVAWAIAVTEAPYALQQQQQAYGNAIPSCATTMQQLHRDYVQGTLGCPAKYQAAGNCPKGFLTYIWEDDSSSTSANNEACLNIACCGMVNGSILGPFAQLGTWGLFWVVALAVTAGTSIKIARRQGILAPNTNRFLEYLCAGLQFIFVLLFIILILTRSSKKPQLNPNSSLQQSTPAVNPINPDFLTNYPCINIPLDSQIDGITLKTTPNDPACGSDDAQCANQGVRITIFTDLTQETITLPDNYQNDAVRLYWAGISADPIVTGTGATAVTTTPVLSVEGKKDDLKKFFKTDARLCALPTRVVTIPQTASTVKWRWVQVSLTNPTRNLGTNAWTGGTTPPADITVNFAAQAPWNSITTYTVNGVIMKVTKDSTTQENAVLTPFKKIDAAPAVGANFATCNYARTIVPYPFNDVNWKADCSEWENIATLTDAASTNPEGSFQIQTTGTAAAPVSVFPILREYQPYTVRLFIQCFEGTWDTATTVKNAKEYSAYKDIRVGGYPRITSQDVGVIVVTRTDFKTEQAPSLRRARVLAQVKRRQATTRRALRVAGTAPTGFVKHDSADVDGLPQVLAIPQGTLQVRYIDAATGQNPQSGIAIVAPVDNYLLNPAPTTAKGGYTFVGTNKWLSKCLANDNDYKTAFNRLRAHDKGTNGTVNTSIYPGYTNITAVRSAQAVDSNYHSYARSSFLYYGRNPTFVPYTVSLVPKVTDPAQIRVLLEWGSQAFDLDLFVKFSTAGQNCWIGYPQASCGGAQYHNDNFNGSEYGGELATINLRSDANYLIYVRPFSGSSTDKKVTRSLGKEPFYSNVNNYLTESFARITVYVNNFGGPAFEFPVPGLNQAHNADIPNLPKDRNGKVDKTKLTWLAFCIKGSVGPRSIIPLSKFWVPAGKNHPAPTICDDLYRTQGLSFD